MAVKTIAASAMMVLVLAGCKKLVATDDLPAWISSPDSSSREAVQAAVNQALNTDVALAADALTSSSLLTIQRDITGTLDNQSAQGRNMDRPVQFRLVINGADCVLIDQRDQSRYVLRNTRCSAR